MKANGDAATPSGWYHVLWLNRSCGPQFMDWQLAWELGPRDSTAGGRLRFPRCLPVAYN